MPGADLLSALLKLSLVFLFLSAICSVLREFMESLRHDRARGLDTAIRDRFGGEADNSAGHMTARVYGHPLLAGLYEGG